MQQHGVVPYSHEGGLGSIVNGKVHMPTGYAMGWNDVTPNYTAGSGSVMTIRMQYTPHYAGNPGVQLILWTHYTIPTNPSTSDNYAYLSNNAAGNLVLYVKAAGVAVINAVVVGAYVAVSGQEDEIEVDLDLTGGTSRVFVNGVQLGGDIAAAGVRAFGRFFSLGFTNYDDAERSFRHVAIFPTIQHTANYVPMGACASSITSNAVSTGTVTAGRGLSAYSITRPLRIGYDTTKYVDFNVDSAGKLNIGSIGDEISTAAGEVVKVLNPLDTTNLATAAAVFSGGVAIAKSLRVGGTIYGDVNGVVITDELELSGTTDSTSTITGTLRIPNGGAGIDGSVYVGGNVVVTGSITTGGNAVVAQASTSASTTWTGPWTADQTITHYYSKIGNVVTCIIPQVKVAEANALFAEVTGAVPAGYRPTADLECYTEVIVYDGNGVRKPGELYISSGGNMAIGPGVPYAAYGAGTGVGWPQLTLHWTTA
jgi:hypothetical protein